MTKNGLTGLKSVSLLDIRTRISSIYMICGKRRKNLPRTTTFRPTMTAMNPIPSKIVSRPKIKRKRSTEEERKMYHIDLSCFV